LVFRAPSELADPPVAAFDDRQRRQRFPTLVRNAASKSRVAGRAIAYAIFRDARRNGARERRARLPEMDLRALAIS